MTGVVSKDIQGLVYQISSTAKLLQVAYLPFLPTPLSPYTPLEELNWWLLLLGNRPNRINISLVPPKRHLSGFYFSTSSQS